MWTRRPALYPALRVGLEGVRSHPEPADLWSWGSGKPCRSSGAKGPGGTPEQRRRCSVPRLSVRVGGYGRVRPLPQGPTGLGRSRRGLGERQVQRSFRRCACVRARVCWGDADAREPRIPPTDTAAHHTRGHTQDTHAEGEGHAARGQGLSAPPKPTSLAPSPTPARGAEGQGGEPCCGEGEGRPLRLRPPPQLGAGKTPAPLPRPRQASPPAPPGAPLARSGRVGARWGARAGPAPPSRVGGGALSATGEGRLARASLGGAAPPRAPRPAPPPAPARPRPAPAQPPAHSEVSCAECGQVPGSFTAPPPGSRPPRPAPVRPADPSAPGRLRRRCRVSRSGSRSGIRRAGGAGRGRGPGAAALQPGPSAVPVRGDRAARAMPAGTPPAAGAR